MYCMALKVYTCEEAARGPKTFLNIFCKLLQQNEPSPAWQWFWFQYQLTLLYAPHVYRDDVTLNLGRYYIWIDQINKTNFHTLKWVPWISFGEKNIALLPKKSYVWNEGLGLSPYTVVWVPHWSIDDTKKHTTKYREAIPLNIKVMIFSCFFLNIEMQMWTTKMMRYRLRNTAQITLVNCSVLAKRLTISKPHSPWNFLLAI
jgi:hypothetical protein